MSDLALELQQLSSDYPIALLPVRLETRFSSNPKALRIRIYPDEIFADSHQRAPSAAEWQAALTYWTTGWEPSAELDAWRVLTTRYAPGRAAWLVGISRPTNHFARPSQPPEFPAVALRDEVLPEVRAAALPRAWMVIAYRGGVVKHRVTSNDIIEPLALSFDPNVGEGDPSLVNVGDLTIETSLRWAVDYAEAERVGMAVTMPLYSEDLTEGFDRVVVLGVRTQANEVDGTAILDELLAAHRFTRGVALVPQGTPTNNTSQALAGYPPPDDASARFALERTGISLGATSDGLILNSALGLDTKRPIFRHVAGAGGQEQTRAAAMNTALWPCTLGYYLEQMMAPLLTAEQIAGTRAHFRDHVRGRGPLPLMRIGRVPYGVLPVTSVVEWEGSDDPLGHGLASFLRPWREAFLARAASVPRVGASNDPDADLLGVLTRDAHSREVRSRTVYGPAFIRNLMLLLGESMSGLDLGRPTHIAQALAEAGLTGLAPRVAQMTLGDRALRIGVELVSKKTLSEIDPLDPNYLDELRTATVATLRLAGRAGDPAFDNPLLYHLLRQATLVELTRVGTGVAVGAGVADAIDRVERELHRIGPGTDSRLTAWERLDAPITGVTGGQALGVWLLDPVSTDATRATVREHRAALATLASAPTAELARLTSETLDTCSHRLDAWITSLASRRLAEMREAHDEGVYLGAYGWVENLRPRTPRAGTAGGFIHAPSAAHAATAAVLRNAHLTRTGVMRDQAAVDLSSTRVRGALELLDGVRQGLPLGAILGFRLERALHDQQLDQYIAGFRAAFPLGRDPGVAPSGTSERIAARNVADGIAVRTAITGLDADTLPWSTVFPFVAKDDRPGVATVLFALDADVDAAAELLLAESVHQTIQGKTERAAATLASLAGGNAIPDPEVARTPRRGLSVTHRVGLLLGTPPALAWPASPRSRAEPRLAAWVEQRLPMATRIACTISYPDPANPPHRRTEAVTLDALGLGALDVLALARTTGESGVGELEARLRAYASMEYGARHDVAISHDPSPDLSDVAILDALELARLIDEALRHGRPMTAADLSRVGAGASPGLDEIELATRANAAVAEFTAARVNLIATLTAADLDSSSVTAAALRGALWGVAAFAVRSALPGGVDDADPIERAALIQSAHRALVDVDRVLAASASAATSSLSLQAIFGGTLAVLPTFTPDNDVEVDDAIAYGPTLVGDPLATRRWFEGAAAVREPLAALRLARMVSEALTSTGGDSRVAQFPHEPGLPWAGGTFASSSPPRAGTVSLVAEMPFGGVSSSGFAGVVFDEWSELIPAASQDTCIAVHHDAPSAEAGQCILLAVPPTRSGSWTLPNLEAVINETLDLAKIRAVDAEQLGVLGLLAPTTFLAVNLADDTVGRDLALYAIDDNLIRNPE